MISSEKKEIGKVAVITGAVRGIGKAISLKFAADGVNIVANDVAEIPQDFIDEIQALGVECFPYKADITDFNQMGEMVSAIKDKFGRIDYLVNNAGVTRDGLIIRMKEEDFDFVINVNLKGAFNTIRHISPLMLKQRFGSIINISSVVGLMGNAGQANYSASKAGLIGLTKSTARELGSRGITVNAIAPGFFDTAMTQNLPENVRAKYLESIPLGRYGTIQELADVVHFVANCKYMTGQVVSVDGGMY
ncbi:MAG: 3-oxoacyl-[acyl-carrier-protein] reductase [Defluviitaleaceae bacterium]|nr:3-oxoacyl-[acyl-carrier-protein] reductase [Defluviitaleaceae bacterium]